MPPVWVTFTNEKIVRIKQVLEELPGKLQALQCFSSFPISTLGKTSHSDGISNMRSRHGSTIIDYQKKKKKYSYFDFRWDKVQNAKNENKEQENIDDCSIPVGM